MISKFENYKDFNKEELIQKIEELESIIEIREKSQYEFLDFPGIENLGSWYWMVETNRIILNEKKFTNLGYNTSEIPKDVEFEFFIERLHPEDYIKVKDTMRKHLFNESDVYEIEYRIRSKMGDYIWHYDAGKVEKRDEEGKPLIVSGIAFDITKNKIIEIKLKEANNKLKRMAMGDELTVAFNRKMTVNEISNEIEKCKSLNSKFSLIMFDLDNFKKVNDIFGHDSGDIVLKRLAKMVIKRIRQIDAFGRWGGEEFVILLPDTQLINAIALAEDIRIKLSEIDMGDIGRITASFGVATYCERDTFDTLIKRVEINMNQAKNEGRNCIRY